MFFLEETIHGEINGQFKKKKKFKKPFLKNEMNDDEIFIFINCNKKIAL